MTFYIKPPGGTSSLTVLEQICTKRLWFLLKVNECDSMVKLRDLVEAENTVEESDCLIEGTRRDRISHFMLRYACCDDPVMTAIFLSSEAALFRLRLSYMNHEEICALFENTNRECKYIDQGANSLMYNRVNNCIRLIQNISEKTSVNKIVKKYLAGDTGCFLRLPFQYVLELIARRQVVLSQGTALIPYDKLHVLLQSLFEEQLKAGIVIARNFLRQIERDKRMTGLIRNMKAMFKHHRNIAMTTEPIPVMNFDEVDIATDAFPLCMSRLHRVLRKQHRLPHQSRIVYSLFLKEIGLPVNEAVKFWQHEYSKPPKNCHDCSHDWLKDSKRYTYSIRHLYGLEGSRINYRGHSCGALQSMSLSTRDACSCPYKNSDETSLHSNLKDDGIPTEEITKIVLLSKRHQFEEACMLHMVVNMQLVVKNTLRKLRQSKSHHQKADEWDRVDEVLECLQSTQEHLNSQLADVQKEDIAQCVRKLKNCDEMRILPVKIDDKVPTVKQVKQTITNLKPKFIHEKFSKCGKCSCSSETDHSSVVGCPSHSVPVKDEYHSHAGYSHKASSPHFYHWRNSSDEEIQACRRNSSYLDNRKEVIGENESLLKSGRGVYVNHQFGCEKQHLPKNGSQRLLTGSPSKKAELEYEIDQNICGNHNADRHASCKDYCVSYGNRHGSFNCVTSLDNWSASCDHCSVSCDNHSSIFNNCFVDTLGNEVRQDRQPHHKYSECIHYEGEGCDCVGLQRFWRSGLHQDGCLSGEVLGANIKVSKPSDYFKSYQTLVAKLKQL